MILFVFAIVVAILLHLVPGSTYATAEAMNVYFGTENKPGSWTWEHLDQGSWAKEWEPFKYRIVFRGAVDLVAHFFLLTGAPKDIHTYWLAFMGISVLSHAFAIWACDQFLQAAGAKSRARLAGVGVWLLLPPVLFAYIIPVQTKEDFLAYGLIFLALRAMLKGDWISVVVICVLGAFVRETLLIISGLFLLGTNAPRKMKFAVLILPICIHIGLRLGFGVNGYQVFRETNLLSILLPLLALALTFGFGWVPLVRYLAMAQPIAAFRRGLSVFGLAKVPLLTSHQERLDALRGAFPYALVLLFVAHFFMGRIQEIRITFLLSPFVLLALAEYFRARTVTLRALIAGSIAGICAAGIIVVLEAMGAMTALRLQMNPLIDEFAQQKWWAVAYLQMILATALFTTARYASVGSDPAADHPK
ncbi:MAG: hypothetical protein ABJF50_07710 [Paracoccaceae bacterium]